MAQIFNAIIPSDGLAALVGVLLMNGGRRGRLFCVCVVAVTAVGRLAPFDRTPEYQPTPSAEYYWLCVWAIAGCSCLLCWMSGGEKS